MIGPTRVWSKVSKKERHAKKLIDNPPKDRRLRVMWNSNGAWIPSGYGVFQRDLLYRLLDDHWKVAQIAFFGLDQGPPIGLNGLTIYPKMYDQYGSDAMVAHGRHWGADVMFSMQDVWTLQPELLKQINHWIPYVPIDTDPVPDNVISSLKYAYKIITFSRFGQKALEKKGYSSTLIVEGTDTNIFKPMDKTECRKTFNLKPDTFIVGMVGANKPDAQVPRKGWQEGIEAFKEFHDKHPDSIFFFHSNQTGGFPIREYAKRLGLKDCIVAMDEYLAVFHCDSHVMNQLYNSFDILIHPSTTEGFGLCVIEAMSSGTPVIVNNCTSMPEMVVEGVTGEICNTSRKHLAPNMGYIYFADVPSLVEKMEKLYTRLQTEEEKISADCHQHVVDNYNIDTLVKEKWIPLLQNLQNDLLNVDPATGKILPS